MGFFTGLYFLLFFIFLFGAGKVTEGSDFGSCGLKKSMVKR